MKREQLMKMMSWCVGGAILFMTAWVGAASEGRVLDNLDLKDADDMPTKIPHFGKKVLFIVYADSQTADDNDPLADAIKKKSFDQAKFTGMGIANLKDSWQPDFMIRMAIRRKIAQYHRTILTDDNGVVPTRWGLGDCDDKSVAVIIGKDRAVKYIKKGPVRGDEIEKVIAIIQAELQKP